MTVRLTSDMLVHAALRRANASGGFATVLARGDATAGGILAVCREQGRLVAILERLLGRDSHYAWQRVGEAADESGAEEYLRRRRMRDPDLWVIELDIAESERFAAESMPAG